MPIHVTTVDHVATVTVDNPGQANALNGALMDEFAAAFAGLAADDTLRAAVLTGAAGRSFIGGADVREMAVLDAAGAHGFITRVHRCCAAIRDCPVPVLAAINGHCFGAGLEIAASCDTRVAVPQARFGMPEVRLGIPSVVEAALLPGLVGWGRARHMLLTGDVFPAADGAAWGLLEQVTEDLPGAVAGWTASICAGQPRAVRRQKALMREWEDLPLRAAVEAGRVAFVEAYATAEPHEAMRAFLEARRK